MELVYLDGKKEPYTLSSIVAECADINHRHLKVLLNKHRADFKKLGEVTFKISPSDAGQNVRDYILNEQQATLLITYLRNTEPVREFKTNLVKAFFEMRDELTKIKLERASERSKRLTLNQAIKRWEKAPKYAYATIYNLLLKGVTGCNKKQLMAKRGGETGLDCLNSVELAQFQALEDMAVAMINLNFEYADIQAMVFRKHKEVVA